MERRTIRIAGVLVVATACLLSIGAAQVPDACETADALRNAKLYDRAVEAYNAIVKPSSTPTPVHCAVDGLKQVRDSLLFLGKVEEDAKRWDQARDLYGKALAIDPHDALTTARFDHADKESKAAGASEAYQVVRSLASSGRYTEASKKLTAILDKDPYLPVPPDLKYLVLDDQPVRWWQLWQQDWVWPFKIVVFSGLVLLLLLLLSRIRRAVHLFLLRAFGGLSVDFKDFDEGATDLKMGKTLSALAQQQYLEFKDEGGECDVGLIDGDVGEFTIPPPMSSATPQLKAVAEFVSALLNWVIPSRVLEVSGALHKPGDRGAGLTLTLTEKYSHGVVDTVTLWQQDFGPSSTASVAGEKDGAKPASDPAPFYSLAGVAGYWAVFEVQKYMHEKKPGNDEFAPLGTGMWESYAAFRAGVLQQPEDGEEARRLYALAYQRDSLNYGALANLGSLSREDEHYEQAAQLLLGAREAEARAIVRKGRETGEPVLRSDVWFKTTYLLAATYAYMPWSTTPPNHMLGALSEARFLVAEINRVLGEIETSPLWDRVNGTPPEGNRPPREERRRFKKEEEELCSYLRFLKPNAHLLYAGILMRTGMLAEAELQLGLVTEHDRLNARVQYNLACYHSEAGAREAAWALPERAAVGYERALDHLGRALTTGGRELARWARDDPSLKGVRTERVTQFNEIVARYSPGPQISSPLGLAGLAASGEVYAQRLRSEGITTADQLTQRAAAQVQRQALATRIRIVPNLVLKWARLADLMRIDGVEVQEANLLAAADIDSLNALAVQDPADLARMLGQINQAQKLMKEPPALEVVAGWVDDAIHTVPRVG